jgi:adenylosuccinate synthase
MINKTVIVDLQFGSTGKGLIAGYLSQNRDYDVVVSANMPNAGHTFVDSNDRKWINKVLPSGVYSKSLTYVGVGPAAVFDPERLVMEIDELYERVGPQVQVVIHENAAILLPRHKVNEAALNSISSTMQGSMEASFDRMRRNPDDNNTAGNNRSSLKFYYTKRGNSLSDFVASNGYWVSMMTQAKNILAEGAQGYSLGMAAGFYPYCTSRDCTASRVLSDCGVPNLGSTIVVGSARVHPIRVGDTKGGTSGPCYPDQEEISWADLGVAPETTTVTGRVRRVFTFSETQIREAMLMNGVSEVFLNFCNYDPEKAIAIGKRINQIAAQICSLNGVHTYGGLPRTVRYYGFGPRSEDILEFAGHGH